MAEEEEKYSVNQSHRQAMSMDEQSDDEDQDESDSGDENPRVFYKSSELIVNTLPYSELTHFFAAPTEKRGAQLAPEARQGQVH